MALSAAAVSIGAGWSSPAHAEDRDGYSASEPLDVMPSHVDGLSEPGAWVSRAPTLTLYYAATHDLSIGTHLCAFLPLGTLEPAGSFFVRQRLGSPPWFRSTVDVALAHTRDGGPSDHLGAAFVGSRTEFALARQHRLTLEAGYGYIDGALGDVDMAADVATLGATYSLAPARWVTLHATALYASSGRARIGGNDAGSFAVDLDDAGNAPDRVIVRGTASVRAGNWQFDAGAVRLGSAVMPWVGIFFPVGG